MVAVALGYRRPTSLMRHPDLRTLNECEQEKKTRIYRLIDGPLNRPLNRPLRLIAFQVPDKRTKNVLKRKNHEMPCLP